MNFRTDSLFRKLQEARDAQGKSLDRLNELMIFLEDPPPLKPDEETTDKFQRGCDLVNGWGFACGRSAVYSLYKSFVLYWRMQVANSAMQTTEEVGSFTEKIRHMAAQRTVEMLSHPELDPQVLVGLARIEFQKEALLHDKEKLKAALRSKLETAVEALRAEIEGKPAALAAFNEMLAALAPKKP